MDIVLIVLAAICLLLGLAGSILPLLPGPPLSYVGLLLLHFTDRVQFSTTQLMIWLALVIFISLIDYIIPILGVKKWKGTRWGTWGCLVGTIGGFFVFPPWGVIIGPFIGAVIGELLGGQKSNEALKSGLGAFIGFVVGTALKFAVSGYFIFCFIRALL